MCNTSSNPPPKKERWRDKNYPLQRWVLYVVLTVLLVGFIFPLFAEVIIGTIWPANVKGVEIWNQFTSVILGIIATVLSVVSIIMGFKSYDDSAELNEKCIQLLERMDNIAKDVSSLKNHQFNVENDVKSNPKGKWDKEEPPEKDS